MDTDGNGQLDAEEVRRAVLGEMRCTCLYVNVYTCVCTNNHVQNIWEVFVSREGTRGQQEEGAEVDWGWEGLKVWFEAGSWVHRR